VGKSLRKSATCKDNIKVEHGEIDLEDGDGWNCLRIMSSGRFGIGSVEIPSENQLFSYLVTIILKHVSLFFHIDQVMSCIVT
jgi:hypothetical protein